MKSDADKTIESLKKINEFPFYAATYYGNYKIDEYSRGKIDSPQAVIPFFEDLFTNIGAPISLTLPKKNSGQIGCSAFYCKDREGNALLGKNLDWKQDPVLLLRTIPNKGYKSLSMVNLNFCDLFNIGELKYKLLLSPYVPLDGINEKGLVVTMLSVYKGAKYLNKPGKISVGDFNIIRIILDLCGSVDEAIKYFNKYNLMQTAMLPIHYIIADKDKSCIIEFANGEMNIYEDKEKNYLTNFIKLNNPDYKNEKENCNRYKKIEKTIVENKNILNAKAVAKLLNDVSVQQQQYEIRSTIWSIVYNIYDLEMKIRIGKIPKHYSVKLETKT